MLTSTTTKEQPESYFRKQILCLKILGVSLTGNESIGYRLYSFLFLFIAGYLYTFLDMYELFKHDFETFSGIVIYATMVLVSMMKATILLKNRIRFGKLLKKIQEEPFLPNPNRGFAEEEKLIRECNFILDVQMYGYWIGAVVTHFVANAYALSTRLRSDDYKDWKFGFGTITFFDITRSPTYEISLFYQALSIFLAAGLFTGTDLTIIGVLAHLSYQFKILQNYFRVIMTRCYEDMLKDQSKDPKWKIPLDHEIDLSKIPWKYLQKSIKQAASYHQAIIDIAKEMDDFFRYLLLVEFLISLGCMCFQLYHGVSQPDISGIIRSGMEFTICVFQVATICYWGEQVMFESQQVSKAVWESNFVGTDVRYQKALVLIMCRSQKPTKLTAGRFTDICLTTFTWIMRSSYSAFMVIRNSSSKND